MQLKPEEIQKAKLAEMLGVEKTGTIMDVLGWTSSPGLDDANDALAIDELSRRGIQIEIPQLDTSQLDTATSTPRLDSFF